MLKTAITMALLSTILFGCSEVQVDKASGSEDENKFEVYMDGIVDKFDAVNGYSLKEKGDEYIVNLEVTEDLNMHDMISDLRSEPKKLLAEEMGSEKPVIYFLDAPGEDDLYLDIEKGTVTTKDGTEMELEIEH